MGCKLDINILQAHVFILKKNEVYLEKQVSWKQKLMGRKWPYTYNEFQLPSFAVYAQTPALRTLTGCGNQEKEQFSCKIIFT